MRGEHRIMVGAMGSRYEQLLRLEVSDEGSGPNNRYFSMTGTGFSCRTKEALMDGAEESLQELMDEETSKLSPFVQQRIKTGAEADFTEAEKLEWLGDVEEWVTAPDGIEWGIEHSSGGQNCDRWELMIPHRTPAPLDPDTRWTPEEGVDVLWFIGYEQYGQLLDLWHAHHLQGTSLNKGEPFETPQWAKDLATEALTLEQAFLRWWWVFQFAEDYTSDEQALRDVVEDVLLNYKAQEGIKAPWSVVKTALEAYLDEAGRPFDTDGEEAEAAFWQGLEWWFIWGWGKVRVEEI